jgi:hypothetical protein
MSISAIPQTTAAIGSLEVSGRVKIDGKQEKLMRKRFYLLRGGLTENKPLVERLAAATIESRDCFYTRISASSEFICWLKTENCDSPYCRGISDEDITRVPEFRVAFDKGMRQFRGRRVVAADWLMTSLTPVLASGYYRQRRTEVTRLLGETEPLQSSMTDSVTVKSIFIDIPLSTGASEKFLVTNILPIEFAGKSYLWACEVEIGAGKSMSLRLSIPEGGKPVKNCEVWVKELPICKTGACSTK